MAGTKYDVIVGGTKAKIAWDNEGAFRKRYVRREIEQQLLSQSQDPLLTSRGDHRQFYQSSWAGGATWWKPLLTTETISTYFQSNHMDMWSEPGKIRPANKVADAAATVLHDNIVMAANVSGQVVAIGSTITEDSTNWDVYEWAPASNAFTRITGTHSAVDDADTPLAMVFNPSDSFYYVLHTGAGGALGVGGGNLARFQPGGSFGTGTDIEFITNLNPQIGSNIFLSIDGLMVYTGDVLYSIDISGSSKTKEFDDGLGFDWLSTVSFGGTNPLLNQATKLAVASPEGIYYVKNVLQDGQPVAWVFRVDRDEAGSWVGEPIATLPVGSVALSITRHMGQVVVTTTPDWQSIYKNDTTEAEIIVYGISTTTGITLLGSMLGKRGELDETPYAILGASGPLLYIGGHKRLWIYDAVRGGLHTAFEWPTELADGPYKTMFWGVDSDGDTNLVFVGTDRQARTKNSVDNPDTVTSFGDDETHYTLESNFFDGNLPMELKELTKISLMFDKLDGSQEWTIQVAPDEGAFTDRLLASVNGSVFAEADLSGTTAYQFRYKLIYQTKNTKRFGIKAVLITFTTGEMITEWDMLLDGSELLNVDNKLQDEGAFYTAMNTLAATDGVTTLIDNVTQQEQNVSDGATAEKVKVVAVEIVKDKPGESIVRVVMRED